MSMAKEDSFKGICNANLGRSEDGEREREKKLGTRRRRAGLSTSPEASLDPQITHNASNGIQHASCAIIPWR
jgi:hypothetical protein